MTRRLQGSLAATGLAILLLLLFVTAQEDPAVGGDTASTTSSTTTSTVATGADRGNADGVLRIGTLFPVTGDYLFLRPPLTEGVNLAVAELNAAGGIFGVEVEVVAGDSGSDPETAIENARLLLEREGVDVIIGAGTSDVSLALADEFDGQQIVQCAPTSTSPLLDVSSHPKTFRTVSSDLIMAGILADLIADDGHRSVTLLRVDDVYSDTIGEVLTQRLTERDVAVTEVEATRGADPEATAAAILSESGITSSADDSDAILIVALPHIARPLLDELVAAGMGPRDIPTYGTDGLRSTDLASNLDDPTALDGLRGLGQYAGDENFATRFVSFAPNLGFSDFAPHAHDCVTAIALAAVAAGSDRAADILETLPVVTGGGGAKCRAMVQCLGFLEAGTDIDYDGDSGPIEFSPTGEITAGIFSEWSFSAGVPETTGDRPWSLPPEAFE